MENKEYYAMLGNIPKYGMEVSGLVLQPRWERLYEDVSHIVNGMLSNTFKDNYTIKKHISRESKITESD